MIRLTSHLTDRLQARLLRWLDTLFALGLAASLLMVGLTAWPGGARAAERATEVRSAGDFEAVQTLGPLVRLRQGAASSVSVTADRSLLPLLETVVDDTRLGKTLVVRWKRGSRVGGWSGRDAPVVTIVAPRITGLLVSGAGDIEADGLTPPALSARVEGSGHIRATGRAARLAASVAGSGDIHAEALAADAVDVSIAGSGDVRVQADKTLQVSIAGAGDVVYAGNPTVRQSIVGSGTVTRC